MQPYMPVWQLGELLVFGRSGQDSSYVDHVKQSPRYGLIMPDLYRRPATLPAENTVAIAVGPPPKGNEAQSTAVPMMSENLITGAEDGSKTSERNKESSTANISLSNGQTAKTNELSQAVHLSLNIEDRENCQPLSSPESSPIHIRDPVRMQKLSRAPVDSSARNIMVPESDLPTLNRHMKVVDVSPLEAQNSETSTDLPLEDCIKAVDVNRNTIQALQRSEFPGPIQGVSRSDHMTTIDLSHPYVKGSERSDSSTLMQEISLDDRMAAVDISPFTIEGPEESYFPMSISDPSPDGGLPTAGISPLNHDDLESSNSPKNSSMDDHMATLPDMAENDQPPESIPSRHYQTTKSIFETRIPEFILETHDQSDSSTDGRRHPESNKSHDNPRNKDGPHVLQEAKLHSLHSRNLQTRGLAYERRSQLRQARSHISAADEDFMRLIRERRVLGSVDDIALEASFKRLQHTRDKYGPLEEAYNALEERLDREEYEVAELEEQILEHGILAPGSQDVYHDLQYSDAADAQVEVTREPQHPLYEEYMSRLGDADLCREAHSDLVIEHEELLDAQQVRQRVGRELQPEDQMILANFAAEEAKILGELRRIEADVERLRLECIQNGLLGEEVQADETDILKPSNGSVDLGKAEYDKYPLLLEQPGQEEDEKKSKILISGFLEGDTGDRITCWLLHKLRLSCLEVELLARYAEDEGPTMDIEKWQEEVLHFWFIDSANLPISAYEIDPTLTDFIPSPLTHLDKKGRTRFGDAQFIHIIIRSSSLSRKLEFGRLLKLARMKGKSVISV